jgi:hypothetical protein
MGFEKFILTLVEGIANANYSILGTVVAVIGIIFWLVVTSWIWVDSDERTTSNWMRIFYVFIGLVPVVGWIIYLIVRPSETIDEIYWGDLERRYLKYEAKDLGDCPRCGSQLYPGFIFCPNCGKRLKRKCPKCEVYVDLDHKYCPNCGNQMKKDTVKEEEITAENMQKQIEETKEEAHETVKSKKSKYKQEENFIHRVGESIKEGYRLLGRKVKNFFKKIRKLGKKKQKEAKKVQEKRDNQKQKKNDKE